MLHIVCRALFLVTSLNFTLIKPALDISIEHSTDVMDQVNFGYSMKNIPIPSEKDLNLHTAVVHEGKKPFACDLCPMKYTAKNSLQHHVILQHELKDQGINETNFHEHSENPKVAEILRRKSKTLKKTMCKFCDKTLEGGMTGRATHMRESHCDESGNFKCPQCELNFRKYELRWLPFSLYLL